MRLSRRVARRMLVLVVLIVHVAVPDRCPQSRPRIGLRSNIRGLPPSLRCVPVKDPCQLVAVVDDEERLRIALRRLLYSARLHLETLSSHRPFRNNTQQPMN
jgi:hypothetical protein